MISNELHEKVTNEYENVKLQVTSAVEKISTKSKLKVTKDNSIEARSSPLSIGCVWSTSTEKQSFVTFLFE